MLPLSPSCAARRAGAVVARVQADGGLVEHVAHALRPRRAARPGAGAASRRPRAWPRRDPAPGWFGWSASAVRRSPASPLAHQGQVLGRRALVEQVQCQVVDLGLSIRQHRSRAPPKSRSSQTTTRNRRPPSWLKEDAAVERRAEPAQAHWRCLTGHGGAMASLRPGGTPRRGAYCRARSAACTIARQVGGGHDQRPGTGDGRRSASGARRQLLRRRGPWTRPPWIVRPGRARLERVMPQGLEAPFGPAASRVAAAGIAAERIAEQPEAEVRILPATCRASAVGGKSRRKRRS